MSVLKDFRKTKKISVPGYENSVVEIYDGILYGDAQDLQKVREHPEDTGAIARGLAKLIKSWNFTDEKNQALPVSEESLKLLSVEAIAFIAEECTRFIQEKKSS